jgi:hypothetical protein
VYGFLELALRIRSLRIESTGRLPNIKTLADHVSASEATAKTAHFGFTTSGADPAIHGTGQIDVSNPKNVALSMKATAGKKRLRVVLKDGVFYLKNPQAATGVKPWTKIDSHGQDAASQALGTVLSQLQRLADPTQTMSTLASAGRITASRVQNYHGQQVRRYTVELKSKKLTQQELNDLGGKLPAAKRRQLNKALQKIPGTLTGHVLINGKDLPVKFTTSFPAPGNSSGQTTVTETLSQWGQPVHVTPPPASKVRSLPTAGH